jgi:hypothetical protein
MLIQYFAIHGMERRQIGSIALALLCAIILSTRDLVVSGESTTGISWWSILAVFMLGSAAILITYFNARGLDRYRIKWVVFGSMCALCASAVDFFWLNLSPHPAWFLSALELFYVGFPLSVAYAVIRHRVIDVRFVASRTLAFAVIGGIVTFIVVGVDWLFSARLPTSRFEAAIYAGLALLVGFSLNAGRQWIGKTVNYVFFRQWYRTLEQAHTIGDALHHAKSTVELYGPLTAGIANVFSLASTALFERVEDGGFVRVAAFGWPTGKIWHILRNDRVAEYAAERPRLLDIDAFQWDESDLPAGVARPCVMFPIVTARRTYALLLCGTHESGAGIDPDEIRTIRGMCAHAGMIYARSPVSWFDLRTLLDQQSTPMHAR